MRNIERAQPVLIRPRGFTLLELLLALVISGVLAGVLYASLAIAFNARDAAHEELGATATARTALEIVRADLAGVLPPTGILAGAIVGTDATGPGDAPADELTYVTNNATMPTGEELADLVSVTLHLVDSDAPRAGRRLVRDVNPNLFAQTEPPRTRQVLAERVASMNIRYFDGSAWHDTWESAEQNDTQPAAVALTLTVLPENVTDETSSLEDSNVIVHRTFALPMAPTRAQRQAQRRSTP
ncbi:MAG: type II secretion system protein GspJ [Phycisphaeraceae bacterium]